MKPEAASALPSGYRLKEELYAGSLGSVVRAARETDATEVLVRVGPPGGAGLPHVLETDGVLLAEFMEGRQRDTEAFFEIALPLVNWLAGFHRSGRVHHHLHPYSLVVARESEGYSISSLDWGTTTENGNENRSRAALAPWTEELAEYASPERTGRTSIPPGPASDLYSLGVILYELLCGEVPFRAAEPVELIHAHMARAPVPPSEVSPGIPAGLSDVVLRLLEKAPETRYPDADSVLADLTGVSSPQDGAGVPSQAGPGIGPARRTLQFSDQVFGRSKEIGVLTEALLRVTGGNSEVVLIEGPPGIGKSQIIDALRDPVRRVGGALVKGKFDRAGPEAPYAAVVSAFRSLVRLSLGLPAGVLESRRERLLAQLGGNVRVLADVIPELAHVVGSFPPLPELPAIEAQNRFLFAFRVFVGVFSGPDHPLVVALEGLQRADRASLDLLQHLASGSRGHLLIIGTLRTASVDSSHPLHGVVSRLEGADIHVSRIQPPPLGAAVVSEIVSDTFPGCTGAEELGAFLADRTEGNPLLVRETMERLYHDGLIRSDPERGAWEWDLTEIRSHPISDDVAHLMAQRLERLMPATQRLLSFAAWLGNVFDTRTLSIASGVTVRDLKSPLAEAVHMGILASADKEEIGAGGLIATEEPGVSSSKLYQFLHDRVQAVAGNLVPESGRVDRHAAIGRAMLQGWSAKELQGRSFHVLRHLGQALDRLDEGEAFQVAELGLFAADRAFASMDYATAVRLLELGLDAVPGKPDHARELLRDLHCRLGISLSFTGRFEEGARHLRTALSLSRSNLERARVHRHQVVCATLAGDESEALRAGQKGLGHLGVRLPLDPGPVRVGAELLLSRIRLRGRSPTALLEMPELEGEEPKIALEILIDLSTAAYSRSAELAGLVFLRMTNLVLRHGLLELGSYVFAIYGQVIASGLGRYREAYQFGQSALELSERYGDPVWRGRTLFTCGTLLNHWLNDAREDVDLFRRARRLLLDNGDLLWVAFTDPQLNLLGIFLGNPLKEVVSHAEEALEFARASHYQNLLPYHLSTKLWALDLAGETMAPGVWVGGGHSEEELETQIEQSDFTPGIAFARILRMYGLAVMGEYSAALDAKERLLPNHAIAGQLFEAEALFAEGLALMGLIREESGGRLRRKRSKRLRRIHAQFERWSELCSANFESRRLVLLAGLHAGDPGAAAQHLAEASDLAAAGGQGHVGAIAQELLARVRLRSGDPAAGHRALERAIELYTEWGAHGKVRRLATEFPWLAEESNQVEGSAISAVRLDHGAGDPTDVVSLLKATQSFSGETKLEDLVERVLETCVESAGASGGALVGVDGDRLIVEGRVWLGDRPPQVEPVPLDEGDVPSSVIRYAHRTGEVLALDDAVGDPRFSSDGYVGARERLSVLCCPLSYRGEPSGMLYLENHLARGAFGGARVDLVKVLANQAAISLAHARINRGSEEMVQSFGRFVPKEMVQILGKDTVVEVRPGDAVAREMTVLFSDLRGYTRLTESLDPGESFGWLNSYLERISPIVGFYGGFIDKFVGDAIMALFPGDPTDALRASVGMLQELRPLNVGQEDPDRGGFRAGIGLHFGSVMLGSVGSSRRLDITAIGDAVNLASRIEGATKTLGASLLVSRDVVDRIQNREGFTFRSLGRVQVHGREAPLDLIEVLDGEPPDQAKRKQSVSETLSEGIRRFQDRFFEEADTSFRRCLEETPDDPVAHHYRAASRAFRDSPPGPEWKGELRLPST